MMPHFENVDMPELNRKAVLIAVIIPDIARKEGGFPACGNLHAPREPVRISNGRRLIVVAVVHYLYREVAQHEARVANHPNRSAQHVGRGSDVVALKVKTRSLIQSHRVMLRLRAVFYKATGPRAVRVPEYIGLSSPFAVSLVFCEGVQIHRILTSLANIVRIARVIYLARPIRAAQPVGAAGAVVFDIPGTIPLRFRITAQFRIGHLREYRGRGIEAPDYGCPYFVGSLDHAVIYIAVVPQGGIIGNVLILIFRYVHALRMEGANDFIGRPYMVAVRMRSDVEIKIILRHADASHVCDNLVLMSVALRYAGP